MSRTGRNSLFPGILLAVPLLVISIWLAHGAVTRSFDPAPSFPGEHEKSATPPPAESPTPPPSGVSPRGQGEPAWLLPGFPPPEGDFPPDRLFERVDGAADSLIAAGCRKLLFWRVSDPAAEVEVLAFGTAQGAAGVFQREAGAERTPGPGDEAWAGDSSVLFRRGGFYVRIVGDPEATPGGARLLELAGRVDRGIQASPMTDAGRKR